MDIDRGSQFSAAMSVLQDIVATDFGPDARLEVRIHTPQGTYVIGQNEDGGAAAELIE
jgi:hypothetical protein